MFSRLQHSALMDDRENRLHDRAIERVFEFAVELRERGLSDLQVGHLLIAAGASVLRASVCRRCLAREFDQAEQLLEEILADQASGPVPCECCGG